MNLNKISLIAAVAALMLTGCNNDLVLQSEASDNAIEFRTVMDKTRASLINSTDELTSFFVHAGIDGSSNLDFMNVAAYLDGYWTYAPKKYWPADGSSVNFYAYAPIKDMNMGVFQNDASFEYTVPFDQSVSNTAVDLLVASELKREKNDGTVNFTFKHALSSITFSARNVTDNDNVFTISNIEITNLYNSGAYVYDAVYDSDSEDYEDTRHWDVNENERVNYIAGISESGVAVTYSSNWVKLLSLNDYMMVLPQVVNKNGIGGAPSSSDEAYVKVNISLYDYLFDQDVYFWLGSDFEFKEGVRYNFRISFTDENSGGVDEDGDPIPLNPELIILDVEEVENWGDDSGNKSNEYIHQVIGSNEADAN